MSGARHRLLHTRGAWLLAAALAVVCLAGRAEADARQYTLDNDPLRLGGSVRFLRRRDSCGLFALLAGHVSPRAARAWFHLIARGLFQSECFMKIFYPAGKPIREHSLRCVSDRLDSWKIGVGVFERSRDHGSRPIILPAA